MAFFSNNNIIETKHKTMAFTGKWLDSFGEPPVSGSWIIYGTSGSGKTGFALQLAKYLTNFAKVLYWTREQGNSGTFQKSWNREKMSECGNKIIVADEDVTFEEIIKKMTQRKGCDVLIIDSLTALRNYIEVVNNEQVVKQFGVVAYERFRKRMKNKLLIWVSHEKGGIPDTNVGDYIMKLADLKMRVEGFKVITNSRAGDEMKDFIIWDKGAKEYKGT
jgi:predicted ATP-dependent serine protease